MKIKLVGASGGEVTGSAYLVRTRRAVVLVDAGTGGPAEIAAAALKDNQRGTLVGTHTFGTGSRQTLIPLEGGTALLISDAKYYSPSGKDLQLDGVAPDTIASKNSNRPDLNSAATLEAPVQPQDTRAEEQIQLEKALEVLGKLQPAAKRAA